MFIDDKSNFQYTEKDALDDGFLVDITKSNKNWENCLFNYISVGLINKGYITKKKYIIPNLMDLIAQAVNIINKTKKEDWFYSGVIELPNGEPEKIFIVQNSTGKFTLMLPEEY
jgi:hypothetical protein